MSLKLYLDIAPQQVKDDVKQKPLKVVQANGQSNPNLRRGPNRAVSKQEQILGSMHYPAFYASDAENTHAHDFAFYFDKPSDIMSPVRGRGRRRRNRSKGRSRAESLAEYEYHVEAATKLNDEDANETEEEKEKKRWQSLSGNVPVGNLSIAIYLGKQAHNQMLTQRQVAIAIYGKGKPKTSAGVDHSRTVVMDDVPLRTRPANGADFQSKVAWPPGASKQIPLRPADNPHYKRRVSKAPLTKGRSGSYSERSFFKSKRTMKRVKLKKVTDPTKVGPIGISQRVETMIPYVMLPPPQPKQPIVQKKSNRKNLKTFKRLEQMQAHEEAIRMFCEDQRSKLVQILSNTQQLEQRCLSLRYDIKSHDDTIQELKLENAKKNEHQSKRDGDGDTVERYITSIISGKVYEVQHY